MNVAFNLAQRKLILLRFDYNNKGNEVDMMFVVNSLGSLTAVMTSLKPLASVPQLSVTYLSVTKLLRVNSAPTCCFVLRQDRSA